MNKFVCVAMGLKPHLISKNSEIVVSRPIEVGCGLKITVTSVMNDLNVGFMCKVLTQTYIGDKLRDHRVTLK